MPSVEIACIGQTKISKFPGLPFRLLTDDHLVSHRSPRPLFQQEFDALQGCLYHFCNPKRGYNAYELLETDHDYWPPRPRADYSLIWGVAFLPAYAPFVRTIMAELLETSPVGEILFTSDYQFGPRVRRYKRPLSLERFWELHDARKLHMNALYPIHLSNRKRP